MDLKLFNPKYLSDLQTIHDQIKRHPFRLTFSEDDIPSYKSLLYSLSETWAEIIYRSEYKDPEDSARLRKFGYWIHDYRQVLSRGQRTQFPLHLFDYYEQMIQVTHEFLNSGCIDCFYNPDTLFDENGSKILKSERYEWITSESCGIQAPFYHSICLLRPSCW